MKTTDLANITIKLLKSLFATKKQQTRSVATRVAKTPAPAKKPAEKNISYKVNQKACEQYLLDKMVDSGMHNLTSKYHKKK